MKGYHLSLMFYCKDIFVLMIELDYKHESDEWRLFIDFSKTSLKLFCYIMRMLNHLYAALQHLKPGKAPEPNSICPQLILHAGDALKSWLRDFLSSCLRRLKIPTIWKKAFVVVIPKVMKPVGDPKSYRPISLLCVPYKILERLIYATR